MNSNLARAKKLTPGQASILHLFEKNFSESELYEIRDVLTKYFFEKAQAEADKKIESSGSNLHKTISRLNKNRTSTKKDLLRNGK